MKLVEKNDANEKGMIRRFAVTDIQPEDIPQPSKAFFDVVRQLKGMDFINPFTADTFTEQVRDSFVKR